MHTFRRLVRAGLAAMLVALFVTTVFPQGQVEQLRMINQSTDGLLKAFRFRSIGPASMGGRIDDIAVSESDPSVIYVGYAVGGVFKSENNGTTFTPVFETYGTASIGDIAIHPTNPNIVYVGTGEANNRQTSSFGDGIYKTTDGGKTFTNIGLKDTQTIARIVIDGLAKLKRQRHPKNRCSRQHGRGRHAPYPGGNPGSSPGSLKGGPHATPPLSSSTSTRAQRQNSGY